MSLGNKDTAVDPLVTIIACCYNHAAYLEATLDSIVQQTYHNIQLIITDDFSTKDNSVAVIKAWIKRHAIACTFITNKKNEGVCKTFNKALSHANGKYYQVIACDDVMLPHKISTQVAALEQAPEEVAVVHTDALVLDQNSKLLHSSFYQFYQLEPLKGAEQLEALVVQNSIIAPSVLMKRQIFVDIGAYDEQLCYEDWDAWLRLAAAGYQFLRLEEPLVYYRYFSNSSSRTSSFQLSMARDSIVLLDKHRGRNKTLNQKIVTAQRRSIDLLIAHDVTNRRILWKKLLNEKSLYSLLLWLCACVGIQPSRANRIKDKLKRK